MGLDGGLDEDNNFKFGVSASSKTEVPYNYRKVYATQMRQVVRQ